MVSFFAEVKIFRFWPKTMIVFKVPLQNGKCYEAEICAILLLLRSLSEWQGCPNAILLD